MDNVRKWVRCSAISVSAVTLVIALHVAVPAQAATQSTTEFELSADADGFHVLGADGNAPRVVTAEMGIGESTQTLMTADGVEGRLTTLDWLSSPSTQVGEDAEGATARLVEAQPNSDVDSAPTLNSEGNMVVTGGVTAAETQLPEDVIVTPFAAILTTDSSAQIVLGDEFAGSGVTQLGGPAGEIEGADFTALGLQAATDYEITLTATSSDGAPLTLTVPVTTLAQSKSGELTPAVAAASVPQNLNIWVHMTYIPEAVVNIGWLESLACSGATSFAGDNRADTYPGLFSFPSHRTAIRVAANWQNPAPYQIYWEKSTGPTKKLNGQGQVVDTKWADPAGMQVDTTWMTSTVAHFRIGHMVGDPFCFEGSVKYNENVQFWKSGIVAVNGVNNWVPNHEAYAFYNYDTNGNGMYHKIWSQANARYACLPGWTTSCTKQYTASRNFF